MKLEHAIWLLILLLAGAAHAQKPTKWEPVEKSLTALLNEGFALTTVSALQTFREASSGGSAGGNVFPTLSSVPDGYEYNFLLQKQGKWVLCVISNPTSGSAHSRCRSLN